MKRFFIHNLGWKLLSLLTATLLWILVAREPQIATSLNAPLEMKNMPDDLDISTNLPEHIRLEVRGPSGRLTRDNLADAAVVLDLRSVAGPGERTFTFQDHNLRLPMGVQFYKAVPSQITIHFERLITKSVPVKPQYATGPADGYAIVQSWFEPRTVRIVGPESHVQPIDFVKTDPIDLSGIVGTKQMHVHVNVGDPQVRLNPIPQVELTVKLEKRDMN